jgi:hypothetical protein
MNFEKSLAELYVFDTNASGIVGGFPITEIIQLEQKKRDILIGGNKTATVDQFERLRGLVVPIGLFMQNFPTARCELPKNDSYSSTISEERFNQLVSNVAKQPPSSSNKSRKNATNAGKKYTKKITMRK